MSIVRVNSFAVSLDGYAAGPRQGLDAPLGIRGPELFEWFFSARAWRQMHGYEGGSTGVDNEWAQWGMENVGAWILGRNMFGPCAAPGRTIHGTDGGARNRHITCLRLCLHIIHENRSR
jgi:dihydrofolate reductase